ncbi:succinate dehydrogenase hydrophobic membrane anchor subunit [Demequina sp. B12]|uniref:succinate dehydrogenase hydrophobic membrane anchor subunit n=1 Tax=Demequina sp. B12 TaxID=2992757 RepID=UPI00237AF455|nr:succinate dehydrogenase hydrophobic membrane anchor subunit [Demequina sp. B12]MDE0572656.1 succinate dehydrogenase hydrophobic membrane anchor subunit [Demequina sp. B12]
MTGAPELKAPKKAVSHSTLGRAQRWSWIFQRVSGVLLIGLIAVHLTVNLVMGDGINQIDFAFVAGKLANPFWQWFDFTMLVLAMIHGANGMRMIINDYAQTPWIAATLHWALRISTVVIVILGTLVLFTFDPCPAGSDPSLLPSFCEDI